MYILGNCRPSDCCGSLQVILDWNSTLNIHVCERIKKNLCNHSSTSNQSYFLRYRANLSRDYIVNRLENTGKINVQNCTQELKNSKGIGCNINRMKTKGMLSSNGAVS
jgi:hypothetical protein